MASPVEDSIEGILKLVTRLELLLDRLVQSPSGMVPNAHLGALKNAWTEVRPHFVSVRVELPLVGDRLEQAGLTGKQLEFKLAVANWAIDVLEDVWDDMTDQMGRLKSGAGRKAKKAAGMLAGALGVVDVILTSMGAVPGLEPVKEFKGVVEHAASIVSQLPVEETRHSSGIR